MVSTILTDNSVDQFIAIEPTKQITAEQLVEESMVFEGREPGYDPNDSDAEKALTSGESTVIDDVLVFANTGTKQRISSSISPSDYSGHYNKIIPTTISQEYADFWFYKHGEFIQQPLFDDSSQQKLLTLEPGLQFIRIPASVFENQFGVYYLSIAPKYIQVQISNVIPKEHHYWGTTLDDRVGDSRRRNVYQFGLSAFTDTAWEFEVPYSSQITSLQRNRLVGSVVQCISGGLVKNTKIITNDFLDFSQNIGNIVLSPDFMGFDSPNDIISTGDIIRIYPKETAFDKIIIKLEYTDNSISPVSLAGYLLNDAVRDLKTGIIEIYDEQGVTINNQGIPEGNVILSYQVSQEGNKEIRRNLI